MAQTKALQNQVAVVTGASRGLGREFAVDLARCGAAVAVSARSVDELDETARMVEAEGVACIQVVGDVTRADVASACVHQAVERLGPVDLLVNNAGMADGAAFADTSLDDWWSVFEVDVKAPATWIAAVLPGMRARGQGRIVNVSSPAGSTPLPCYSAYCSAKAALTQLTACLAVELRRDGISLLAFGPKALTDLTRATYENDAIPAGMRAAFKASFASDPDGIMRASLDLFRVIATGGADHVSGSYLGDRVGSFDTAEDVARQSPDPTIEAFAAMLQS